MMSLRLTVPPNAGLGRWWMGKSGGSEHNESRPF
jgi:hypothetical protein